MAAATLRADQTSMGSTGSLNQTGLGIGFGLTGTEDHCNVALAGLFQQIVNDMKGSTFIWEDFLTKSNRLHSALKSTLSASSAFLDAFQRIADVATNTRGATKEIGKCLTRMVLRQRSIEAKMKTFTSALLDCLVTPLQEKMEDWKKTCLCMDKEHAKEYKRARTEIKKRSTDTIRLQKKAKKGHGKSGSASGGTWNTVKFPGTGSSKALESWNELLDMKRQLQDKELEALHQAMVEERSRFCLFVSCLKPFLDEELGMLSEMVHLEEISDSLLQHSQDPFQLPPASLQAILDVKATCSSTVSTADILLQDHLANDTYYSSSCSSGSNHWPNYISPPSSPLPEEDPSSPRSIKNPDTRSFDDSHAESYGNLNGRHGSICSISNASTSSYASSDVSSSSFGGSLLQDKIPLKHNKSFRRCFSDNNGQEQHYYSSSIACSIAEKDLESDGEEQSGNDTLVPGSQRRKSRPRRSSLSQCEDLVPMHPLSLAMRNEYYTTIRFSSISSGDSGFISHPDQISNANFLETSQETPESLLTPTTNGQKKEVPSWTPPATISSAASDKGVVRRPPVPPFGSITRGEQRDLEGPQRPQRDLEGSQRPQRDLEGPQRPQRDLEGSQRPHTIAYNGVPGVVGKEEPRPLQKLTKRPPLTQETFLPPTGFQNGSSNNTVMPKDFRRSCHLDMPALSGLGSGQNRNGEETIYANNHNLLTDTSSLPPPPAHWFESSNDQNLSAVDQTANDLSQVTVSMTVRRVKEKREEPNGGLYQTEAMRKQTLMERQLRRHSQIISGAPQPSSTFNKPPPPPLPIRRTPSLHQAISDADADIPLTGSYETLPTLKPNNERSRAQPAPGNQLVINSLQERLRQSARAPGSPNDVFTYSSNPNSFMTNGNFGGNNSGNSANSGKISGNSGTSGKISGNSAIFGELSGNCQRDPRSCLFDQIKSGSFALRKVNADQRRDRSSPFIRR